MNRVYFLLTKGKDGRPRKLFGQNLLKDRSLHQVRDLDQVREPEPISRRHRSVRHLVLALDEFAALGIDFISFAEAVDTSTPMGRMVFTVIAGVAELERSLIRERVMMGLSRASGSLLRVEPEHQ